MSAVCAVDGWSAVASAAANSTLAGVLAGFMINGMILVLGNKPDEMKPGYIRGLSLLFAAFIALGVDAFLFGVVTGENPQVIQANIGVCRRAWTEAMFGAGLLAVGTIAIIAGFVYLFTTYLGNPRWELRQSVNRLELLCNLVRAGVAVTVVTALFMTSKSYLYAVYDRSIPSWGNFLVWQSLFAGVFILVFSFAAVFDSPFTRRVRASNQDQLTRALRWGILCSVMYTVISAVATAVVATSLAGFWNPMYQERRWIIYATVTWVSLVPLLPLWLLLGRAVPSFVSPGAHGPPDEQALANGLGSQDSPRDTGTAVSPAGSGA